MSKSHGGRSYPRDIAAKVRRGDDGNEWRGCRGDAVAIWRYSPDSEARDTGMRRRDDYAIGKEGVRAEEREDQKEGGRSRDYSAVYSNGQSDPHQSQRAAPPSTPDTLV